MEAIYMLLPIMMMIGFLLIFFFVWAVKSGQYDDLETQKHKIFFD
ncbi:MAG: cbb3-type cytochrome oxidase assembly protein CcoS [Candidatus Sericytochromatia bacterium]